MKHPYPSGNSGFTLIELIVAVVILSFGIVLAYQAFAPLIGYSSNLSNRLTAAYLAQEGMEIARNIRDNNVIASISNPSITWSDGLVNCSLGCQADYKTATPAEGFANQLKLYDETVPLVINADGLYSYDDGTSTTFTRKITITQAQEGSDVVNVVVLVTWNYNGESSSFETEGYLYHWY